MDACSAATFRIGAALLYIYIYIYTHACIYIYIYIYIYICAQVRVLQPVREEGEVRLGTAELPQVAFDQHAFTKVNVLDAPEKRWTDNCLRDVLYF